MGKLEDMRALGPPGMARQFVPSGTQVVPNGTNRVPNGADGTKSVPNGTPPVPIRASGTKPVPPSADLDGARLVPAVANGAELDSLRRKVEVLKAENARLRLRLAKQSIEAGEQAPWEAAGVSRRTWYRQQATKQKAKP